MGAECEKKVTAQASHLGRVAEWMPLPCHRRSAEQLRARGECFKPAAQSCKQDVESGRNALGFSDTAKRVFRHPPVDSPSRTFGSTSSASLSSRASRHLTHALGALCNRAIHIATEKSPLVVQKLWRTGPFCGRFRKSRVETRGIVDCRVLIVELRANLTSRDRRELTRRTQRGPWS